MPCLAENFPPLNCAHRDGFH